MNNYGELVQTDLAQMYSYDDYQYFILLVDAFSTKVFVRPLKTKTSLIVSLALNDIFSEFGSILSIKMEYSGPSVNSIVEFEHLR